VGRTGFEPVTNGLKGESKTQAILHQK